MDKDYGSFLEYMIAAVLRLAHNNDAIYARIM